MPLAIRSTLKWGYEHLLPGFVSRPLDFRLRDQIVRLEGRKSDFNLDPLRGTHAIDMTAWRGLGSLGYEIVRHVKPRIVVELGSHGGFSAFCLGLALRDLGLGGRLYAVDTWQGDPQTGEYGDEIFLDDRAALGLQETVIPLRMTFEEASRAIEPGVDLLHVDGWHTFAAVRRDFATFRPLLSRRAIVMFHDVRTIYRGMRWFWALMRLRYESCTVPYMHGLGIIRMP
jgi:predicted O-methyltransferase YrrM